LTASRATRATFWLSPARCSAPGQASVRWPSRRLPDNPPDGPGFLDTTSDFAEIIFALLGVAAKLERRRILERTARGRADAKAKGVKFGRKPIITPHQQNEARKRLEAGETQRSLARSYNVSQSTISRLPSG
jgi:DNA invertase Pin-like site-specific DNA recombinase